MCYNVYCYVKSIYLVVFRGNTTTLQYMEMLHVHPIRKGAQATSRLIKSRRNSVRPLKKTSLQLFCSI